ncbi:ABC transporter permease [Inconstantimicrobium mannanitabidum]|uniref:Permease n=1 Tax=Inconstantimicrobium mannanitabidum TaxID=1604901 RepID=A0ACB5RIC6_9CLOT|nr:FtsX-like permease family protein [Clostridium sp. TW13]GKX68881.1 permease [Clostridium sp. TW13]
MKIFFKYVVKCMTEKKGRFCLLILAIALSTGLLVTSTGAIKVAMNSFVKPMLASFDGKEIYITPKDKKQVFISTSDLTEAGVKNVQGEIRLSGVINDDERINLALHAREDKYIDKTKILEGNISDLKGETCIISKRVSKDRNLKVNDTLEFYMAGVKKQYKIVGISSNEGIFYSDKSKSFGVLVPYEYISKELKVEGKYNLVLANKAKDNVKDSIKEFNDKNTKFIAEQLFDEEAVNSQLGSFTSVLYVMLIIVVFMSGIIIYGSFKLTITERLSVIGTFLSQGATTGTIKKILYLESIGYGIVGAIFGNALGVGGLYLINYLVSPLKAYGIYDKVEINPYYLVIGAVFAILLSLVSALIPVRKIKKLQVKEVILNNVNISMTIGWGKFIIGVILLGISLGVNFIDAKWAYALSGVFVIVSVIGLVLMYPKLVDILTNVLYKLFRGRSKTVVFALNNLRTSKVLLGNITLIIVSVLSIMMITSAGTSLKNVVTEAYTKMNSDITVSGIQTIEGVEGQNTTDKLLAKIKENKDVNKDSIQISMQASTKIGNTFAGIEGIDASKYRDYNQYLDFNSDKNKDMFDRFAKSSERELIITDKLKDKLGKNVGDTITLNINDIKKDFKIAGSIDGKLYQDGFVIFMKNEVLKKDFNFKEADQIMFKTNKDAAEVKKELLPTIKQFGATAITKAEMEKQNAESNQMVINILSIFSYMAIFIAALGVLNNIIIGFLQRKRELAVLSSVGMPQGNRSLMLLIESVLSVVWAMAIAVPYSYLGLSLISRCLKVISMPLEIVLDLKSVPGYFCISLALILLATIPVLFKSRKLSIIQELKYE